ncbi:hypothetical protein FA95DRAFT_1565026 [Auriscalpium vulgare]|uniref:Uncharacterized protein n=1 Tax=Auriscalpium vulgare TaxID=40419 RepID=A0ACB8RC65_9AGAM|nr:hypothetical protein FA95DRAFT_1565026 [Auriscalpium vulgare]
MAVFPLEIQLTIIESAYTPYGFVDVPTLRACALVCRAWTPTAQRMLFRRATCGDPYENIENDSRLKLLDVLRAHPHLATYLRYIDLFLWSVPGALDPGVEDIDMELLELCPNIEGILTQDVDDIGDNAFDYARLQSLPVRPVFLEVTGRPEMVNKLVHMWPSVRTLIVGLEGPAQKIMLPHALQSLSVCYGVLQDFVLPENGLRALSSLEIKYPVALDTIWFQQPRAFGLLQQLRTLIIWNSLPPQDILTQLANLVHLDFGELAAAPLLLPKTLRRVGYHPEDIPRLPEDLMKTELFVQALRALEDLQLVTSTRRPSVQFLTTLDKACCERGIDLLIYSTRPPAPSNLDWL